MTARAILKPLAGLVLFITVLFITALWSCLAEAEAIHIKVATITPDGHRASREMRNSLNEIGKLSGGEVRFTLYAGGVAGDEVDVIRKMRGNLVHMSTFTGVGVGHIAPNLRIVEAPRLFKNHDEIDYVRNIVYDEFVEEFDRRGYVLLGWADAGFVYIFSKHNLLEGDGFGRFKMWVWKGDPQQASYFNDLGFNTVPLHIADVVTGLETGMVDTCFGPPIAATAFQWHTRLKYMLDFPICNAMGVMLINKNKFLELSETTRAMMVENLSRISREGNLRLRKLNEESLGILMQDARINILRPSDRQLADYEDRARITIENAIRKGLFSRNQYDRIRAMIEACRQGR